MVDEDEHGIVFQAGFRSEVLIVDFSEDVMTLMREYDPVTDSLEAISSFSEAAPTALPSLPELVSTARAWAEEEGVARLHFYSARDEPPSWPPALKKPPAKRVTNASLAEQVQALAAQDERCRPAASMQKLAVAGGPDSNSMVGFLREKTGGAPGISMPSSINSQPPPRRPGAAAEGADSASLSV